MRAVSSLFLFAACLGLAGCGGVEGDDGFYDDAWETWAETSEALTPVPQGGAPGGPEDGRAGRPVMPVLIPISGVGGSSPDPIPARQAVSAPAPDRRLDFQFPECEPFPAVWRDACNRWLGGGTR